MSDPTTAGVTVAAEPLRALVRAVVRQGGSSEREAVLVAEQLVEANLTGHDSHGVGMLPRYVEALAEGGLRVNRRLSVLRDAGTILMLNGNAGYGQVMAYDAMALGIERAAEHGVAVVGLANSHHIGRIGHWAEQCIAANLVSIHFVNVISRPVVAPFGGRDARFVTNPFCVGIPMAGGEPIVLDFATSRIAMGKVRVAFNKGEQVRPETLLDAAGEPTTDPAALFAEPGGAILPFGEHKGYGMAVVCEMADQPGDHQQHVELHRRSRGARHRGAAGARSKGVRRLGLRLAADRRRRPGAARRRSGTCLAPRPRRERHSDRCHHLGADRRRRGAGRRRPRDRRRSRPAGAGQRDLKRAASASAPARSSARSEPTAVNRQPSSR